MHGASRSIENRNFEKEQTIRKEHDNLRRRSKPLEKGLDNLRKIANRSKEKKRN